MKVVLTEAALADLIRIGRFIGFDNRARAATFVAELKERCRGLAAMPHAYPLLPGRETSGIRRRVYGDYLIFYRLGPETIEVLRVLNGAQDYESILFPADWAASSHVSRRVAFSASAATQVRRLAAGRASRRIDGWEAKSSHGRWDRNRL